MTESTVSCSLPDWSRETKRILEWDPGRSLIAAIRAWNRAARLPQPLRGFCRISAIIRHRFWTVVSGADIPLTAKIGGGLLLPHPNGIVIHPDAEIGPNCLIFQQVTIGEAKGLIPRVGGHVDIGAGAKLLGGISVGNHACIGANAVVLIDVPNDATAVGCPARLVRR